MILMAALLLAAGNVPTEANDQFRRAEAIRSSQPIRARGLYERAARYGHPQAQAAYGMLLFEDGKRTDALRWLKAAADQDEPRGMLLWGTALFNGDGVAVNRALGYALVARAARAGLPDAEGTRSEMDIVMSPAERMAANKLNAPAEVVSAASASKKVKTTKNKGRRNKTLPKLASASTSKQLSAAMATPITASGATGAWRIQLGAFRKDGSAQELFARLAPRLPGKQATYLPLGSMTRLLAGPYGSKDAAQAACRSLGAKQACFPVTPR
ncbi:MAG TPA: SPOR domain-containing protein [Sphingomicrobium sp.]|jgi:cell division septation protein DedD|nr:SPOR domain-containing protein [Sphingomicrobium sp.]